jgi:hypothetical protein
VVIGGHWWLIRLSFGGHWWSFDGHWLLLVVIGCHWLSLVVIGGCWWSLVVIKWLLVVVDGYEYWD